MNSWATTSVTAVRKGSAFSYAGTTEHPPVWHLNWFAKWLHHCQVWELVVQRLRKVQAKCSQMLSLTGRDDVSLQTSVIAEWLCCAHLSKEQPASLASSSVISLIPGWTSVTGNCAREKPNKQGITFIPFWNSLIYASSDGCLFAWSSHQDTIPASSEISLGALYCSSQHSVPQASESGVQQVSLHPSASKTPFWWWKEFLRTVINGEMHLSKAIWNALLTQISFSFLLLHVRAATFLLQTRALQGTLSHLYKLLWK